jgi:FkbM family methyltransferase
MNLEKSNTPDKGNIGLALDLARLWAKYVPRGKGWFPRLAGRFSTDGNQWVHTKHGGKLAVTSRSFDVFANLLNNGGSWDYHVFLACARYLGKDKVFYDIGANVGYMSVEVARFFNDQVFVIAVEPQPDLALAIARSARLNAFNRLKVLPVMLGNTPGSGRLFIGSHQIHASAVAREKRSKALVCPAATIDVIKIDIEGGELAAFQGAHKTLAAHPPVIVFESDINSERFGYTQDDVIGYLRSVAEYQFYNLLKDGSELPLSPANRARPDLVADILAKPASANR